MNLLRSLKRRSSIASKLSTSRGAQALIKGTRRVGTVEQPLRFAVLELTAPRNRTHAHEVRDGAHVVMRHRSRDVDIFDEIFVGRCYEPPPEVESILRPIEGLRVLDLGGNIGLFGAWALARYPGSTVTSVEPDPHNLSLLRRCVALNDPARWTTVEACAGVAVGAAQFAAGNYADSFVDDGARERTTIEVPVADVFPLMQGADFLKVDIEGSEWPLLLDQRLPSIAARAVVIEWHQRGCPTLHGYDAAHTALTAAGYTLQGLRPDTPHHGVLWGWRA